MAITMPPVPISSAHMMMLYAPRNSNGLSLNVVYITEAKIFLKPQKKSRITLSLKPSQRNLGFKIPTWLLDSSISVLLSSWMKQSSTQQAHGNLFAQTTNSVLWWDWFPLYFSKLLCTTNGKITRIEWTLSAGKTSFVSQYDSIICGFWGLDRDWHPK